MVLTKARALPYRPIIGCSARCGVRASVSASVAVCLRARLASSYCMYVNSYWQSQRMSSPNPLNKISAISLFVEDLAAAKAFYTTVFGAAVLVEDATSAAVKFENVIINLLLATDAAVLVDPAPVGGPDAGKRFQISIWVDDLEAVVEKLAMQNVRLLTGPQVQPWGLRTVTFVDPAGHSWEVGQQVKT